MSKKKICLFCIDIVLIAILIAFDRFTKQLALAYLKGTAGLSLISGVLELRYLENRGAAFSLLQGKTWLILLTGFLFIGIVIYFIMKMPDHKKYNIIHIVVSFFIAGGIGNMMDRFLYGYVVDFISFVLINFPIFNVADIYVVVAFFIVGIFVLFIFTDDDLEFLSFRKHPKQNTEEATKGHEV